MPRLTFLGGRRWACLDRGLASQSQIARVGRETADNFRAARFNPGTVRHEIVERTGLLDRAGGAAFMFAIQACTAGWLAFSNPGNIALPFAAPRQFC